MNSFTGLDYWYNCVKEKLEQNKYILSIIGNKSDLIKEIDEEVKEEEGKKFAEEKDAFFKLISAKEDPKGIIDLFETLLDELIQSDLEFFGERINGDNLNKKNVDDRNKCC